MAVQSALHSKSLFLTLLPKIQSAMRRIFQREEEPPTTELVIDPSTGTQRLRIRAAHFVYCRLAQNGSSPPPNTRAGILADAGFKHLTRGRVPEFDPEPPVAEREVMTLADGTEITIFGRPDGIMNIDGYTIPVELKNSSNIKTITAGRLQAGLYAWLYRAPFALVIHHADLRMDAIAPLTDQQVKARTATLALAILSGKEKAECTPISPSVLASEVSW